MEGSDEFKWIKDDDIIKPLTYVQAIYTLSSYRGNMLSKKKVNSSPMLFP